VRSLRLLIWGRLLLDTAASVVRSGIGERRKQSKLLGKHRNSLDIGS